MVQFKTRKRIKKKAQASFLTQVVLFAAITVLILIFIAVLLNVLSKKSEIELCREQVLFQAKTVTPLTGEGLFSLDSCKRNYIKFYNDNVKLNDKNIQVSYRGKTETKFKGLNNDIVNYVVAKEVANCWYQFLEGKQEIFNKKLLLGSSNKKVCFICSEIEFDSTGSLQGKTFTGFYDYTKNNNMIGQNYTYYNYFAEEPRLCSKGYNYEDKNCWEAYAEADRKSTRIAWFGFINGHDALEKDINFSTDKKYVIFFVREGVNSYLSQWTTTANQMICQAEGLDCEKDPALLTTQFTYVIPSDQLNEQCDTLAS